MFDATREMNQVYDERRAEVSRNIDSQVVQVERKQLSVAETLDAVKKQSNAFKDILRSWTDLQEYPRIAMYQSSSSRFQVDGVGNQRLFNRDAIMGMTHLNKSQSLDCWISSSVEARIMRRSNISLSKEMTHF